jgi:hypothetical protein
MYASRRAAHIPTRARALIRYEELGGLANDASARNASVDYLAQELGIDHDTAAELLADALARRATNKQSKE